MVGGGRSAGLSGWEWSAKEEGGEARQLDEYPVLYVAQLGGNEVPAMLA